MKPSRPVPVGTAEGGI